MLTKTQHTLQGIIGVSTLGQDLTCQLRSSLLSYRACFPMIQFIWAMRRAVEGDTTAGEGEPFATVAYASRSRQVLSSPSASNFGRLCFKALSALPGRPSDKCIATIATICPMSSTLFKISCSIFARERYKSTGSALAKVQAMTPGLAGLSRSTCAQSSMASGLRSASFARHANCHTLIIDIRISDYA